MGYLPELRDGEVLFHTRTIITVGETFIIMDIEELANFYISIRRHGDFVHSGYGEIYFPHIEEEFMGNFLIRSNGTSYEICYINYNDMSQTYEVSFPTKDIVNHVLSLERTLSGYMNLMNSLEDEKNILFQQLEKCCGMCINTPTYIKILGENTTDGFVIEMATNLFSFFAAYWHFKKGKN